MEGGVTGKCQCRRQGDDVCAAGLAAKEGHPTDPVNTASAGEATGSALSPLVKPTAENCAACCAVACCLGGRAVLTGFVAATVAADFLTDSLILAKVSDRGGAAEVVTSCTLFLGFAGENLLAAFAPVWCAAFARSTPALSASLI